MNHDHRPLFSSRKGFSHNKKSFYIKAFAVISLSVLGLSYGIRSITPAAEKLYSSIFVNYDDELGITEESAVVEIEQGEIPEKNSIVENKIQRGESLYILLTAHGLSPAEVNQVSQQLKGKFSVKSLRPGQSYRVEKDPENRFLSFSLQQSMISTLHLEKNLESGTFHVWKEIMEYDTRLASLTGTIESNLSLELQKNKRYSLIGQLQNLFASKINFRRDIHPGTSYRILYEENWLGEEYANSGNIMAAEISFNGSTYTAYRYTDAKGKTGYYDENGRSLNSFFLAKPCNYSRISSGFGYRRHPILGRKHFHGGIDLAAPTGTPVYAVADGKIVYRGRKGAAGNMITINHSNGYYTKYLHLSRFSSKHPYGSKVHQGDIIGYVGSTGRSTGPHLDFRVIKNGKLQNPLTALKSSSSTRGVSKAEMQNFMAQLSVFRAQLNESNVLVANLSKKSIETSTALN